MNSSVILHGAQRLFVLDNGLAARTIAASTASTATAHITNFRFSTRVGELEGYHSLSVETVECGCAFAASGTAGSAAALARPLVTLVHVLLSFAVFVLVFAT